MTKASKKTAAVIYHYGHKYSKLGNVAAKSFKIHNPEVDLYHITDENEQEYEISENKHHFGAGCYKYLYAAEIMKKYGYDKVMVLGGDTITCGRLDEFLDNSTDDILVTLDYPYQPADGGYVLCPDNQSHLNADVICFNNINAIVDIVKISKHFPVYAEQAALNIVVWTKAYNYSHQIVDGPYDESTVHYNVRSKGNMLLPAEYQDHSACGTPGTCDIFCTGVAPKYPCTEKPWAPYINQFYVYDGKLYTKDDKQIKVWHYCEGFGGVSEEDFRKLVNNYIFKWFNEETRQFFKERCAAGDFFEKEFSF